MLLMVPVFLIGGRDHRQSAETIIAPTSTRCGRPPPPAREVAYERRQGTRQAAPRAGPRRRLRRRAGALRRRPRGRRGRDRRPARHERRRQVHAAEGHLRGRRGRPTAPSSSTGATSPTPRPTRSPASASAQVPGRPGRLPQPHRRGEPAGCGLAAAPRTGPPTEAGAWCRGARVCSPSSSGGGRAGRRPLRRPAADAGPGHGPARRPRLLLIDELSLGPGAGIVEQLLPSCEALATQGTTVVLVEQSVNVALTVADTAVFMEKGEVRFHGPTAELLERPTCCGRCSSRARRRRSGVEAPTAAVAAADARADRRRRRTAGPRRHRRGRRGCPAARPSGRSPSGFGGIRAVDDVTLEVARRRDPRHHRAQRRRQDHAVRPASSGYLPADRGRVVLGGRRRHRRSTPTSGPAGGSAARSRTPGCSRRSPSRRPSPSRASAGSRSATRCQRRAPPARRLRQRGRPSGARVDELIELLGLGAVPHRSSSASSRPARGASSTSPACSPTGPR